MHPPHSLAFRAKVPCVLLATILILAGCQTVPPSTPTSLPLATPTVPVATTIQPQAGSAPTPSSVPTDAPHPPRPAVYGYTYQQPDGNRVVYGRGSVPGTEPVDVPLAGRPTWLVAGPTRAGSIWAAVLEDGQVQAFQVSKHAVTQVDITPMNLEPSMPPLLEIRNGMPMLVTPPSAAASRTTHPVALNNGGRLAYIEASGDLVIWENDTEVGRLAVNALPDARLLQDEAGRLLLLTDPTTRYTHGVLGDQTEAASISLVETKPALRVSQTIRPPEPQVVEGTAPIWADWDGDGVRDIIVTVSDANGGARILVFNAAGERIAAGPAIGRGFRWRHQLAVAPFGPEGALELADVLTPHIGGTVEFYRWRGEQLRIEGRMPGYTSHVIGTRNLDMAAAGDFDGDGQVELLVPNQSRSRLGAIQRTSDGAQVDWTVPVGGRVVTNLAGVALADGRLAVGVAREDGVLRLWLPQE